MTQITRRKLATTTAWAAPIILTATTIPAYASSTTNCQPAENSWRRIPTTAIGHGFNEKSYNRHKNLYISPEGYTPQENIHNVSLTAWGTIIPLYGNANDNSDSFGTNPVKINEIAPKTGEHLHSFPIGNEEIRNISSTRPKVYVPLYDPSERDVDKEVKEKTGSELGNRTGYYERAANTGWSFIQLKDPNGVPYIAEHTVGVVPAFDNLVMVLINCHNDKNHNLKYEQSAVLIGNKELGFRVLEVDDRQHFILYQKGRDFTTRTNWPPLLIHFGKSWYTPDARALYPKKTDKPFSFPTGYNDAPKDTDQGWGEASKFFLQDTSGRWNYESDGKLNLSTKNNGRFIIDTRAPFTVRVPNSSQKRVWASPRKTDASVRGDSQVYKNGNILVFNPNFEPGVLYAIDTDRSLLVVIAPPEGSELYQQLRKTHLSPDSNDDSTRPNGLIYHENTIYVGQTDGHILAVENIFDDPCSTYVLTQKGAIHNGEQSPLLDSGYTA